MKSESYEVLLQILREYKIELVEIEKKITANELKIKEASYFADSILNKDDENTRLFSPRSTEDVCKKELSRTKQEIVSYELENKRLNQEKKVIQSKIERIEFIFSREEKSFHNALNLQEEDRARIARDLHDISLQNVTHLIHKIELASMYIDKDSLRAKLELSVVNKNIKTIINEMRNIIFDLRPMSFDDLGLKAALERLLAVINTNNMYEIETDIDEISCETDIILVSIYRTVNECITNIKKHADATKIIFSCKRIDNNCNIVIEDNGKGFTIEEAEQKKKDKHFGISLINERIELLDGTFEINSIPNVGTKIIINIPLENGE